VVSNARSVTPLAHALDLAPDLVEWRGCSEDYDWIKTMSRKKRIDALAIGFIRG
jgi:hypothetical protein